LSGWKDIAAHLNVSIRTAQNLEKDQGLPVRRKFGIKAPVYALIPEIDEWIKHNQTAPDPPSGPKQLSGGPAETSALGLRPAQWVAAGAVLVAVALAVVAFHLAGRPKGPPASLAVRDQNLIVRNADGHELWRFQFPSLPIADFYDRVFLEHRTWIGDLGDSGRTSVLALFMPSDFAQKPHLLYSLSGSGQLLWEFVPGRTVLDGRGFVMAPPYYVREISVLKAQKPEDTRIAVASVNYAGQAGQIAFLDASGRVRGEYWHPGHLSHLAQVDIDGDGRNELLAGGANNAEHDATIVVLDPLRIKERSTPRSVFDPALRLINMPEAHEKAVILFARGCVGKSSPYLRIKALWVTSSRIIASVADDYAEENPASITYEFDHRLNLVAMTPVPQYAEAHREMERAHKLDHAYDEKREMADLRKRLVIRWGDAHNSTEPRTTASGQVR